MDDLGPLRVLAAVRDLGTVTEAGAVLGLSPSAVSQQLARLGRQLGTPLTVRSGRRVALTPAAHGLLERATPLLEQLEEVLHTLGPGSEQISGRVRVAAFTTAIRAGIPSTLAGLRDQHPRLVLELIEADPDDAYRALASGRVDLAIVHHWEGQYPAVYPTIDTRRLHHDVADVIARRDHPVTRSREHTVATLATYDWVSTGRGTLCHAWLASMFAQAGQAPQITAELSDFTLHMDYVSAGLGLALIPRLGRPSLPGELTALALPDPPARIVSIATRHTQRHDQTLQAVTDQLQSMFPGRPPRAETSPNDSHC